MEEEIQDGMLIAHSQIWVNGLTTLSVLECSSPLGLGTACQATDISFPLCVPASLPQDTR